MLCVCLHAFQLETNLSKANRQNPEFLHVTATRSIKQVWPGKDCGLVNVHHLPNRMVYRNARLRCLQPFVGEFQQKLTQEGSISLQRTNILLWQQQIGSVRL